MVLRGMYFFVLTSFLVLGVRETLAKDCEECKQEECPSPTRCIAGTMKDRCGCCVICARTEGERCDLDANFNYGRCGDNLDCTKRNDGGNGAVCKCQLETTVCGSDGNTYTTVCSLIEQSSKLSEYEKEDMQVSLEHWGPCNESPTIVSPPKDVTGPLGANLTLACEARGTPAPTITWKFVSVEEKTISLPSDDQGVSIQMRGGPESFMATGYAQIASLDPSYSGVYHCIASNNLGQAYAKANVGVYKNEF